MYLYFSLYFFLYQYVHETNSITNKSKIKITDIKTFHNTSPSTHLRQYAYGEVLHKYMLTPSQNL